MSHHLQEWIPHIFSFDSIWIIAFSIPTIPHKTTPGCVRSSEDPSISHWASYNSSVPSSWQLPCLVPHCLEHIRSHPCTCKESRAHLTPHLPALSQAPLNTGMAQADLCRSLGSPALLPQRFQFLLKGESNRSEENFVFAMTTSVPRAWQGRSWSLKQVHWL